MRKPVIEVCTEEVWGMNHHTREFTRPCHRYWARIKGANGQIVATTETYTRKRGAIRAAEAIKRLAAEAEIVVKEKA